MRTITLTLPEPHAGQRRVIDGARRWNAIACGRRFGKSTLGMDRLIGPALEGFPVAWYSPSYPMLSEIWRDLRRLLQPVTAERNEQEKRIGLITGGLIRCWSLTDPDSSRGHKYKRVVIDEAAKVKDLRDAWNAVIRPTLADYAGDAWLLSTPRGMDFFHECFIRGQDDQEAEWASWQMPSWENPHVPRSEFEEMRHALPERVYQQEILATFLEDAGGVFRGVKAIVDPGRVANEDPIPARRYATGVDLARVNDFTVISTLDAETGRQVYHERFNQISWELQIARILNAARKYPGVVIMDSTGVGDPLYEQVRKQLDPRSEGRVDGYNLTSGSKEALIDRLAIDIENAALRLMDLPVQTAELQAYQYEVTASRNVRMNAPPGMHDDTVIALALANWGRSRKAPGRFRAV